MILTSQTPFTQWLGQVLHAFARKLEGAPPPAPPTRAQAAATALEAARVQLLDAEAEVERFTFTIQMLEARVERLLRVG